MNIFELCICCLVMIMLLMVVLLVFGIVVYLWLLVNELLNVDFFIISISVSLFGVLLEIMVLVVVMLLEV